MRESGLIHIYTGDGKGKTTSAVGLACRALGTGLRVYYTSFHKRPEIYGYSEMDSLKKLGAEVLNFAKGHPHLDSSINAENLMIEVEEGLKTLEEILQKKRIDLLIMDEILISVRDQYISEKRLIDFINKKPSGLELVLTGRGATDNVIELANYVSYVKKIKHPYDEGITSRSGIEF